MPLAFKETITVEKGASYDETWIWKRGVKKNPVDLTNCTARMQVRASVDSEDVLVEYTTTGGNLILDGTTGKVRLQIDHTDTAALDFEAGVYDLEIVQPSSTSVRRLMEGDFVVKAEVTR
jgi:hypothetical protein